MFYSVLPQPVSVQLSEAIGSKVYYLIKCVNVFVQMPVYLLKRGENEFSMAMSVWHLID